MAGGRQEGDPLISWCLGSKRWKELELQYPGQGNTPNAQWQEPPNKALPPPISTEDPWAKAQGPFEDTAFPWVWQDTLLWPETAQHGETFKSKQHSPNFRRTKCGLGLCAQLTGHGREVLNLVLGQLVLGRFPWLQSLSLTTKATLITHRVQCTSFGSVF